MIAGNSLLWCKTIEYKNQRNMTDGQPKARLQIISSSSDKDFDVYELQLQLLGCLYTLPTRYSQLRKIFNPISNGKCKFPSRKYLGTMLRNVMPGEYRRAFREDREASLNAYFSELSKNVQLGDCEEFLALVEQAKKWEAAMLKSPNLRPKKIDNVSKINSKANPILIQAI